MSASDPNLMLHLHRSRCIDAFARAEAVISAILCNHAVSVGYELLGQKLAAVRNLPAGPKYSKASRTSMHAALDELEALALIRNDLVHGELIPMTGNGQKYAVFINPRQQSDLCKQARLMTAETFASLEDEVKAITARIEAAAQPPRPRSAKPSSTEPPAT